MSALLPALSGYMEGIVGHDLIGWSVQCQTCGDIETGPSVTHLCLLISYAGDPEPNSWDSDHTGPRSPIRRCPACRAAGRETRLEADDE